MASYLSTHGLNLHQAPSEMGNRTRDMSRCCHESIYTIYPSVFGKKVASFSLVCTLVKSFFPRCPTTESPGGKSEGGGKPQADRKGIAKRTSFKSRGGGGCCLRSAFWDPLSALAFWDPLSQLVCGHPWSCPFPPEFWRTHI